MSLNAALWDIRCIAAGCVAVGYTGVVVLVISCKAALWNTRSEDCGFEEDLFARCLDPVGLDCLGLGLDAGASFEH